MKFRYELLFFFSCMLYEHNSYGLFSKSSKNEQQAVKPGVKKEVSETLLNNILANQAVLLFQTLNYHWNLTGPEFHDYHILFDQQYKKLFEDMDSIAERVRSVGGFALGSMKKMLNSASLKEDKSIPAPKKMIKNLLKQYESLIEQIRVSIVQLEPDNTDVGTVNFLQELITQYEKTAWMLRSLQSK